MLSEKLKSEIIEIVSPSFMQMRKELGTKDFARAGKNINKYVKYSEQSITDEIDKIFDLTA